jgi:hypothetical protein
LTWVAALDWLAWPYDPDAKGWKVHLMAGFYEDFYGDFYGI